MKTAKILKLTAIVLFGLGIATQLPAGESQLGGNDKKPLTLTVDTPIIEFMAKAYADRIDASDIVRMQKMTGQIDHLTVTFADAEARDYVLKFKPLDEQGLEEWMFNAGYLASPPENGPAVAQEMTPRAEGFKFMNRRSARKTINLTVEKPIVEYLAKIYADQIDASDIFRLQKLCCQIDHITVSFVDEDASDYVLKFKHLDKKGLEAWMFSEGYLISEPAPEAEIAEVEAWMLDSDYLE